MEQNRQTSRNYWSPHSSRGWGGKINTECQRVTYVTKKNNIGKGNGEWVTGVGDASLYTEPWGDGILGEEG